MQTNKFVIAAAVAIATLSALAGCSSTPSDAEVREALKARMVILAQTLSPDRPLTDKDSRELDEALAKLKVIGCKKADPKNGFNCDWTGTESLAFVGSSGRVVKADSGWMLMKDGE